jgi:deoxyribonuclease-4
MAAQTQRLRYGMSLGMTGGVKDTLTTMHGLGLKTAQFYMGGQNSWELMTFTEADMLAAAELATKHDLSFLVHSSLKANLAHAKLPDIRAKSSNLIQHQLVQLRHLPGGLVLHVGKVGPLSNVIESTNNLYIPPGVGRHPSLLFENGAGQGTELGKTWDELRLLFEGIDSVSGRVGLCIDTCHLFAAGMSNFCGHESIVRLFEYSDYIVKGGLTAIHLNDSVREFGCKVDRHESLGYGKIWGPSSYQTATIEGFGTLMNICRERQVDIILETGTSGRMTEDLDVLARYDGVPSKCSAMLKLLPFLG